MRKIWLIGLLAFVGCDKDITSSLKDPMAEAAKRFCNENKQNLIGYSYYSGLDQYTLSCGGTMEKKAEAKK